MACEIEYTDEFEIWWDTVSEKQQNDIVVLVNLLAEKGTNLPFPYSSGIIGSKHSQMRELRVQSGGKTSQNFLCFRPPTHRNFTHWWR
jgi:hypothetical protein